MIRTFSTFLSLSILLPLAANAAIDLSGKLAGEGKCTEGLAELFISNPASKTLLYQVSVPPKGNFNFKLKEGRYEVRAANASGCEAVHYLDLKPSEKKRNVTLTLNEKTTEVKKEVKK